MYHEVTRDTLVIGIEARFFPSTDFLYQRKVCEKPYFGAHGAEEIPVPIPNTEVKLSSGDYTATSGKLARCRIIQIPLVIPGVLSLKRPSNLDGLFICLNSARKTAHGKMDTVTRYKIKQKLAKIYHRLPLRAWVLVAVFAFVIIPYGLVFGIPKSVAFSYAGETCVPQLSIAPSVMRQAGESGYSAQLKNITSIGNVQLFSTSVCFSATKTPEVGKNTVAVAPFGGWFAAKRFTIAVADAPTARTADVTGRAISTALPLRIKLTSNDSIHQYRLAIADKNTTCDHQAGELACEVLQLELAPGSSYEASLYRSFKGEDEQRLLRGDITTLLPIVLTGASVTDGKVIYDTPADFRFTFDQPLKTADVSLTGNDGQKVAFDAKQDGSTLIVTPRTELPRKVEYNLVLKQVVAQNGNSLSAPLTYKFTTSGGPKVTDISIGSSGVAQTTKITVTFDQPVAESVDITKVAYLAGVTGSITKLSPTQFVVSISKAPLCAAFTVTVDKGIASGSNTETSEDAWSFASRVICGSSSIILATPLKAALLSLISSVVAAQRSYLPVVCMGLSEAERQLCRHG